MATTNATIEEQIEAELKRLGAHVHAGGDLEVYFDEGLPDGYCRIADSQEWTYGLAVDFLEALRAAEPDDEKDDDGNPSGWHSAWAAISVMNPQFSHRPPEA